MQTNYFFMIFILNFEICSYLQNTEALPQLENRFWPTFRVVGRPKLFFAGHNGAGKSTTINMLAGE